MAELVPGSLARLTTRAFQEYERTQSIFTLPSRKFAQPDGRHDTSVAIHGRRAGTPLGPAAGPHTQMAQNIVLSWLAGARIIELKTVQVLDSIRVPRPCIETRQAAWNVEWSQELRIEQSLEEYVKASMLIDMLAHLLGRERECLFDMSVGYELDGISSDRMRAFMRGMMDARSTVDALRSQIPDKWRHLRDLDFTTNIAPSVTLSAFHGCPPGEIEEIADFVMAEIGLDCTIKLNPTLLGRAAVDEILHGRLGFDDVQVPPSAFDNDPDWNAAVAIVANLQARARELGRSFAVKLTNTLIVENRSEFLPRTERFAYLSGPPLHVLAMHLVHRFRSAFGTALPISFSAGIDRSNYPDAVRLGLAPVTVCTDLLKQGGYGRLQGYATELGQRMDAAGATTIGEFLAPGEIGTYVDSLDRYARYRNDPRHPPKKTGRLLTRATCSECDLCIGVCPNAAIFTMLPHRIAIIDGWCNDCGNCETFCPDVGAPYRVKPRVSIDETPWI
ncbi:MAG TPA: glutamate synthase [Thermoanaerobaculia bacterium]